MTDTGNLPSRHGLKEQGFAAYQAAYWNLVPSQLIEKAIQRNEGMLAIVGALVVNTGRFTGRSPKDKYIVRESGTETTIEWGDVNQPMAEAAFDRIYGRLLRFLENKELFVQDCFAGADAEYRLPIRVVTQRAWHALFARQLFIRPNPLETDRHKPEFTVLFAPEFYADPEKDGTRSGTCIAVNFKKKIILIAGTEYAGEVKKSIFGVLNYLLPERGVLPMHCSANMGAAGDVALFFGLSGTGKTTLSADPRRGLIGDDEHGWSDRGVFNFEGGCYAKCIHLSPAEEPRIWGAIRYGTVLENVVIDPGTRLLNFDSDELTENTRAAYPLDYIENAVMPSVGGHPSHILFLTADAFGVLPPVARLTPDQAMYHFLSGYTAKLAGTERGLGKEPAATFSAGFGAPFLPRSPLTYARMLGDKMQRHNVPCYLVNTGWVGGPYGVGERMGLTYTRAIVNAVVEGKLDGIVTAVDPIFGLAAPLTCPGVPPEILDARAQWTNGDDYDDAARELLRRFHRNFAKFETAIEA